MNIYLAQQNYLVGDFSGNLQKITAAVTCAAEQGADLVVFSELSLCGYPPRDFLEFEDFIRRCEESISRLKPYSMETGILVGAPCLNPVREGKDLFNAAWLLYGGEVQQVVHKTCLPTYDIFDEYRYFEPAFEWKVMEFKGCRLAVTICEDIWNLGDDPLYRICPMDNLMKQNPDVMINLSASPFDYDQREKRLAVISANVRKYRLPLYYCNAVGSQTEMIFDGGSLVVDAGGKVVRALPFFSEALQGAALEEVTASATAPAWPAAEIAENAQNAPASSPLHPATGNMPELTRGQQGRLPYDADRHIDRIHAALLLGIRDYFGKMGFSRAILGSSGGIDSAAALALASEALGPENVHAVMMPSPFSSTHSVDDAVQLAANLGIPYDIIPIGEVYEAFLHSLKPQFRDLPFGLAEENIQARSRGNVLMAMANKFGYILLNTSNKSELATGYGTLYGDMAGGLSVLGDVYKTQVYALARHINREKELIPLSILEKAPSAELRPGQKDIDSLPDYKVLDPILYQYIEHRQGPQEIISRGYDEALVKRVLKMVNTNEYKRNQFCPIIRVSSKAFGTGRRVPIVGRYLS
jgi:NAD+ synthase (glutamine-hydrolysing)